MNSKYFTGIILIVAGIGTMSAMVESILTLPTVYRSDGVCQYVGQMGDDGQEEISDCESIGLEKDRYHTTEVAPAEFVGRLLEEERLQRFAEAVRRGEHIPTVGER